MFKIKNEDSKTGARTGILETAHGKALTPFFMPVATKGTVKFVTSDELREMPIQASISNSLILSLMPGVELVKEAGGLHKFANMKHVIFTDSGGFQMGSDRLFVGINDKGVTFKDPRNASLITLNPRDVMKNEFDLDSDVAMCLDHMPPVLRERSYIEDATRRTHIWAKICKAHHNKLNEEAGRTEKNKQLLFGIAQGGTHTDLREKSAKFINQLDFDGIALGGLCIGETPEAMYKAIDVQVPLLDNNKPRYLMGVGTPQDIIEAISHGVDCFDSKFPTQNARHGNVFTRQGTINLNKSEFKRDFSPIDPNCDCKVCKQYTKAFLYHLFKSDEKTVYRHVSYHNTYFLQQFMEDIRTTINKGEFSQFKEDFLESFLHKKKIHK